MDSVAIFPVINPKGTSGFRAIAGTEQSEGKTVGEALDAVRSQLSPNNGGTVVVIQLFLADEWFSEPNRSRLKKLMDQWRTARDKGESLSARDQLELQGLVEAELQASNARSKQILQRIGE